MTDTVCTSVAWVLQQLIEAELTTTIGAGPHERTDARTPSGTVTARSW